MLALAVALAGIPPNKIAIGTYGFDNRTCANWTLARKDPNRFQGDEGWIMGFIAGLNAWGPGNGNIAPGVNATALMGWVDLYCASNPLDSVTRVGFKLADELVSRAKR